jgi:hypothetical protein
MKLKRYVVGFLILAILMFVYVDKQPEKIINGRVVNNYGLFNADEEKQSDVKYKISTPGLVCAIVFSETIIVPVIIGGYYIYEPVGPKPVINDTLKVSKR